MQVIDIEKFDKQMEKEKINTKAKDKLKNMETTQEAKKNFMGKIITDPCAGARKTDHVKTEQNHVKGAVQIDKLLVDLEARKAKAECIITEMEAKNINHLEDEIDAFVQTPIGQSANEHVNNLLTLVYNEPVKKKLLKHNLEANPIIRRNNQRVVFNIVHKLPLIIQYPLFVGLEIVKTEDQFREVCAFQRQQQLLRQQTTQVKEEVKEEKKEDERKE